MRRASRARCSITLGLSLLIVGLSLSAVRGDADVIVGDLPSMANYRVSGGIDAFAVATTSCNIGDEPLVWIAESTQHPVIGQNMYRLKDGRFEQIGMSWLKHGFSALQLDFCGDCDDFPNDTALGVGCSDPYGASLNGDQDGLGPRFEVNPATGEFEFPFDDPPITPIIGRRIQVAVEDLDPDDNEDALYFVEAHYIHPDDAQAGNGNNNASYREISIAENAAGTNYSADTEGETQQELAAIYAWQDDDPDVEIVPVDVPDDGRFHVAYQVTENDDGTWHYEYAIHNMNSDRSGGSFSMPLPIGAEVTNVGFHDIDYHSGEPWDGTDWTSTVTATDITWSTDSFEDGEEANALRWGTLYNFRFDCDSEPVEGDVTLGLFKPGDDDAVTFTGLHPDGLFITRVERLACAPIPDGVQLSWVNGDDYTEVEIERDGDIVATLAGDAAAYLDDEVEAGAEHVYAVVPRIDGDPAAARRCKVLVPGESDPSFVFAVEARSVPYDAANGEASFSVDLRIAEHEDHAGYPNDFHGFSMGLAHDPAILTAVEVNESSTLDALRDGDGPGFFSPLIWDDGCTVGVLFDFELEATLAADDPLTVVRVAYDAITAPLTDNDDGYVTVLAWSDGLGTPMVTNEVSVGIEIHTPALENGAITLDPDGGGPQFIRGDLNDDGAASLADGILLLRYMFVEAAIVCEKAGDIDDSGRILINDPVLLLNYLFAESREPDPPFPDCGTDPEDDTLTCGGPVDSCD